MAIPYLTIALYKYLCSILKLFWISCISSNRIRRTNSTIRALISWAEQAQAPRAGRVWHDGEQQWRIQQAADG